MSAMKLASRVLVFVVFSAASARAAPSLAVDFDGGVHAVDGAGRPVAVAVTQAARAAPTLVKSDHGEALRSGATYGYLQFPTAGIVRKESGTVEMWVAPVDWDGSERKYHMLFEALGDGGAIYLYKFQSAGLMILTCQNAQAGPYNTADVDISSWKPGQWHHVAATWSARRQRLFVDGVKVGEVAPLLPSQLGSTFTIGDQPWQGARTSSSLLRQVRVYDRELSGHEVNAHAHGQFGVLPVTEDDLDLSMRVDPQSSRLTVSLDLERDENVFDGVEVPLELVNDRQIVLAKSTARMSQGVASAVFPMEALPAGAFTVTARIAPRGNAAIVKSATIQKPDMSWRGNHIGEPTSVPLPWTPLQVHRDGQRVQIDAIARRYEFTGNALPNQITSQDERLLTGAVSLILGRGNQHVNSRPAERLDVDESAIATTIRSRQSGALGGTVVTTQLTSRLEYDGLLVVDVDVATGNGQPLTDATLEIPLAKGVAKQRHRWTTGEALSGNLPDSGSVLDKDKFIPFAWIGDDKRGLFWFCESDESWPNRSAADSFAIVRQGDTTALRLTIAHGQPLPSRWRLRFGLQATPVKPINQSPWRISPAPHATEVIIWPTTAPDSLRYYGYPEPSDPSQFKRRIDSIHGANTRAIVYSGLTYLSSQAPEYQWFEQDWRIGGADAASRDVQAFGGIFARMNPLSRTYSDFIIWKNAQMAEQFGVDGFYHDNTEPNACTLGHDGCGYKDAAGLIHPTFPILAYRDLYRRLYIAVKQRHPNGRVMAHASMNLTIPVIAYEDAYLAGEEFRGQVRDSYVSVLPLDKLRVEFVGTHFGIRSIFLPELEGGQEKAVAPTQELAAMLLVHDIPAWPILSRVEEFAQAYAALDSFGTGAALFIPYYDQQPVANVSGTGLYVSGYRRPDGKWLLVVANLSTQPQTAAVRLNESRIGALPREVSSFPSRQALPFAAGAATVDVPARGYRFVYFEDAAKR